MALALIGHGTSVAQVSLGISPSKVEYEEPFPQGEDIDLPVATVLNNSDEEVQFTIDLLVRGSQEELAPPLAWFRFTPQQFKLEANGRQKVAVRMLIPREAEPGQYLTFIQAVGKSLNVDDAESGVVAKIGVAMTVRFSVKNVNFHFYDPVVDFFVGRAPFSYIGTGMLLALLAFYLFQRTYGIELNVGVRRKE